MWCCKNKAYQHKS